MEKPVDVTKLESLNVGTFGHIDHGKTTLVYKLTGKWTDTHSEELKRGITIKLGYADCIARKSKDGYSIKDGEPFRYISFVDAPGHEMLMAIMLSGAAVIDVALLVIAANEGIKPQTREHLVALQAKGIKNIIVIQNKIDLVSQEQARKSYEGIKEFVKGTIAEKAEIIPVSSQQEINLDKILKLLCEIEISKRNIEADPVFLIARSFDINKPGTKIKELKGGVLGGALKQGKLKIGDMIEIKPGRNLKRENQIVYETIKTKIIGIRKGSYSIKEASPGGSLALETELDPILTKADSLSGCVAGIKVADVKSHIKLRTKLFEEVVGIGEKKLVDNIKVSEMLMLSVNTSTTVGFVRKIKGNEVEMDLKIPVVPIKGESVGIARNISGHWRLIGFGELVE
jgi:translation initiation factor 2 subunit 3